MVSFVESNSRIKFYSRKQIWVCFIGNYFLNHAVVVSIKYSNIFMKIEEFV